MPVGGGRGSKKARQSQVADSDDEATGVKKNAFSIFKKVANKKKIGL
jgi:hypothetical protein